MSKQPLQPLNTKPKTKFPESVSALIRKQAFRELLFCFSGKSETADPVSFP
jgi:hypothetical protein